MATINLQPGQSSDDAHQKADGTGYNDSSTTPTAVSATAASVRQHAGVRFPLDSDQLPKGSSIQSASLQFYLPSTSRDDANFDIYVDDVDSSPTFDSGSGDVLGRTNSDNSIAWVEDGIAAGGGAGYYNIDIALLIEELAGRPAWPGNTAITVVIRPRSDVTKQFMFQSFDGANPPKLDITYTAPVGATVTVVPDKPKLLNWFAFATKARLCGSRFIGPGTHLVTGYKVIAVEDGALIEEGEVAGEENFTAFMSLLEGKVYLARIRYGNEAGYGKWSPKLQVAVPTTSLNYPANAVPSEPVAALDIPFEPEFISAPTRERSMYDAITPTGHRIRRPEHTAERLTSSMTFRVEPAELATLRAFLEARLSAIPPQAFRTIDHVHGAREWFAVRGRMEQEFLDVGLYELRIDAVQVSSSGVFTLGQTDLEEGAPLR